MSTQSKLLASAAVLALAGLTLWSVTSPNEPLPLPSEGIGEPSLSAIEIPGQGTDSKTSNLPPEPEAQRTAVATTGDFVLRGEVQRDGLPFSDLELTLNWYDGFGTEGEPTTEQTLRIDSEGTFAWSGPRVEVARTALVTCLDPHRNILAAPLIVLPDEEEAFYAIRVYVLDCLLEGRVRDGDGHPISSALVSLNWRWNETTSDEEAASRCT